MSSFLPAPESRLGRLSVDTVFEFYDSPVLFTCRDSLDHLYLVVAADSDSEGTSYLYVPISERRLLAVRTGLVSLRDAFSASESQSVLVVKSGPDIPISTVKELASTDVPEEWLPDADEFLSEELETLVKFTPPMLSRLATREGRELVAMEVNPPSTRRTELPLRIGGPLLTEFQELVSVLVPGQEYAAAQLLAASFVIVLTPLVGDRIFGPDSTAADQIIRLLEAASGDAFSGYLAELDRRQLAHVRDFFSVLSDADTGFTLTAASSHGTVRMAPLALERVRSGLSLLRSNKALSSVRLDLNATIYAINHVKRTCGIEEAYPTGRRRTLRKFSGTIDPSIDIDGIATGSTVIYHVAILRERETTEFDDDQIKYSNRIIDLERLGALTPRAADES